MRILVVLINILTAWLLLRQVFAGNKTAPPPSSPPPSRNGLSTQEAYDILGLPDEASDQEVRDAYTKLMKKLHPDTGGSQYLAERLNAARDCLLKDR